MITSSGAIHKVVDPMDSRSGKVVYEASKGIWISVWDTTSALVVIGETKRDSIYEQNIVIFCYEFFIGCKYLRR